jgi:hypothetical protein
MTRWTCKVGGVGLVLISVDVDGVHAVHRISVDAQICWARLLKEP